MAVQGLDRATAPAPAMAKQMLDKIGGRWWNVYIGGPESGGHGWTPEVVKEYVRHGIDRFMLTYVGRQSRGPLTSAQGRADGLEALRIAKAFGYSGAVPLCLDVELHTFESAPSKAVEYSRAWCATVRDAGARPGVYANPTPLKAMAEGKVPADFVWVASWVSHGAAPHDPHVVPQLPRELWSKPGARAWQYAGAYGNKPCQVLGLDVDINVADLGCLAKAPGRRQGTLSSGKGLLRRGDTGPRVERLTRRLSYVRSGRTGKPYLDGPRRRLGPEGDAALRAFQREHRLDADGIYGRDTAHALTRAVERQRARRPKGGGQGSGKGDGKEPIRPMTLRALIEDVRRLDAETDRAWERLVAYGASRRRALEKVSGQTGDRNLTEITAILQRMEQTLEALLAMEQRALALQEHPPAAQPEAVAAGATAPEAVAAGATATLASGVPVGPNGAGADSGPATPAGGGLELGELSDDELQERIDRLDRAIGRSRMVLMRRYVDVEKKLGVAPERPKRPRTERPPRTEPKAPREPAEPGKKEPRATDEVRSLQSSLNRFTGKYLEGVGPLLVDGVRGPATNKRIRRVKYYLGYRGAEQRSATVPPELAKRMRRPRSARVSNPAMLARAVARRRKQHQDAAAAAAPRAGVSTFDGKPVAAWMRPYLEWARDHGWQGTVNSGYRTPEYSEHLCVGICGAPSCPGRCAGRSSNHSGRVKPAGAIDVSDYVRFAELMRQCPYSPRIFNNLPSDRVHFSATGG